MFPKSTRHIFNRCNGGFIGGMSEQAMDDYLSSIGLWRKVIARDESALFRIVAEQVYLTQVVHDDVKKACVKYVDSHRSQLKRGDSCSVEMQALSQMYRRDFLVFHQPGRHPINATHNNFRSKIMLCIISDEHYDEVLPRSYIESAAIAQSILYELLYEKVFGMDQPMMLGQEMINSKPSIPNFMKSSASLHNRDIDSSPNSDILQHGHDLGAGKNSDGPWSQNAPFPYRIAKSLSPFILRNVEYEVWADSKKFGDGNELLSNAGNDIQFEPGDKCQVELDGHEDHLFNAHIQELASSLQKAVVFVEELGERVEVPFSKLIALPKVMAADCSFKRRGKKKSFEHIKTTPGNAGNAYHSNFKRSGTYGFYAGRRTRINSAGHPVRSNYSENSSQSACTGSSRPGFNVCPNRRDVRHISRTGRQRFNSEPGDGTDVNDTEVTSSLKNSSIELARSQTGLPLYYDAGSLQNANDGPNEQIDSFLSTSDGDNSTNSASSQPLLSDEATANSATDPTLLAAHYHQAATNLGSSSPIVAHQLVAAPQTLVNAIPYYNVIIPMVENITGPINVGIAPSVDPNGIDLPMHDCATMRFFFNLGVQYYRISSYLQQQQSLLQSAATQPIAQYAPYQVNGTMPLGISGLPGTIATPEIVIGDETGSFAATCFGGLPPLPPSGNYFATSAPQQYVQFVPAGQMSFQPMAM